MRNEEIFFPFEITVTVLTVNKVDVEGDMDITHKFGLVKIFFLSVIRLYIIIGSVNTTLVCSKNSGWLQLIMRRKFIHYSNDNNVRNVYRFILVLGRVK